MTFKQEVKIGEEIINERGEAIEKKDIQTKTNQRKKEKRKSGRRKRKRKREK